MTSKPRTIDNIGIDASSRYARDQAQLDSTFLDAARYIPARAEVSVLKPYVPTEFEQYLTPNKFILWANFPSPPTYYSTTTALFSYQLIPSLGSQEKQEADLDKVQALEDSLSKPFEERDQQEGQEDDEKKRRLQHQEVKTVLALLQMIQKFDRVLTSINSRRGQYHKG